MLIVPCGETAHVLMRLTCPRGHQMTAYGRNEANFWPPPGCVKCSRPMLMVEKIADLPHTPRRRYEVKLCAPTPDEAAQWPYCQEVWADRFDASDEAVVFFTGAHQVARYKRAISVRELVA